MRRLFTIGLLLLAFTLQAQDIKSLYISIPDTLSPLLTKVNRQDFGDFLQSNMKAEVKNRFGKTSEMLTMTADYLHLRLTSVSSVEMKLLPVNDSTRVICVAKTFQGPVSDTCIKFYSTEWKELDTSHYIQLPDKDDFFINPSTTEGRDSLANLKEYADIKLIKANLSEKENILQFSYEVPQYMEKEKAKSIRAFLRKDPICYQWTSGKFVVKE